MICSGPHVDKHGSHDATRLPTSHRYKYIFPVENILQMDVHVTAK